MARFLGSRHSTPRKDQIIMLPAIIAVSALGGAAALRLTQYAMSYYEGEPSTKRPKKNARRKKPEATATAEAKPKNTRRASTLVAQAEAATKKVTASDAKPEPEKKGQGRPSMRDQLAALPGVEKA
jgi:hypothetical protein